MIPTTTAEYRQLEPEAAFQTWVIDTARLHGWLAAHITDSRGQDTEGLPDLVLARGGVVILAELKTEGGAIRAAQRRWLAASGGYVWRPGMRAEITELLR